MGLGIITEKTRSYVFDGFGEGLDFVKRWLTFFKSIRKSCLVNTGRLGSFNLGVNLNTPIFQSLFNFCSVGQVIGDYASANA